MPKYNSLAVKILGLKTASLYTLILYPQSTCTNQYSGYQHCPHRQYIEKKGVHFVQKVFKRENLNQECGLRSRREGHSKFLPKIFLLWFVRRRGERGPGMRV